MNENKKKSLSVTAFVLGLISILTCTLMEGVLGAVITVIATFLQFIPIIGQLLGVLLTVPLAILALPATLPCGIIAFIMAKKAMETEGHHLAKPARTMGLIGIILGIIDIIIDIGAIILALVVGIGGLLTPILLTLGISSADSFGSTAGSSLATGIFGY